MLRYILLPLCFACFFSSSAQQSPTKYYTEPDFLLEGSAIPGSEKEHTYDRLPIAYKDKVRKEVWDLSKSSAGPSVRFNSNSTSIRLKWEVQNNTKMNHMAETGIKGVDLYCKVKGQWQYVNTGRPAGKVNEAQLVSNMPAAMREYKLFLPLYDGLVTLSIGVDSLSQFVKPEKSSAKPIVFYGTSITQGGCASRPGMAYTNIIARKLDTDCVNLGFSGNGRMEAPIADFLSKIEAAFFVIDCIPNMSLEQVKTNTTPLVDAIRARQASTPIVFVENTLYAKSFFDEGLNKEIMNKNAALKAEYKKLLSRKVKNIFYIETKNALGNDHEATVDGVHFTDLGFSRFADYLLAKFYALKLVR